MVSRAAVDSTAAASSRYAAASGTGGRKTYSTPLRVSVQSDVRTTRRADSPCATGGSSGDCVRAGRGARSASYAGKRRAGLSGIVLAQVRIVGFAHPRQRVEGQAIAHGRVARDEKHVPVTKLPGSRSPPWLVAKVTGNRQGVSHGGAEPRGEDASQPLSLELVVEARVERIDIQRQAAFAPQVVQDVLESRRDMRVAQPQRGGKRAQKPLRVRCGHSRSSPFHSRTARRRARPARHLCASSTRATIGAVVRRDTTCPARNARCRSARSDRAGARTDRLPGRAWSGRAPPYSTRPRRDRRSTRTSARRPSST